MADYSDQDFLNRLQNPPPAQTNAPQSADESNFLIRLNSSAPNQATLAIQPATTNSPAPATQSALIDMHNRLNAPPSSISGAPTLTYSEKYGRKDPDGNTIPIDFNEAAPLKGSSYWRISQQTDPQAKLDLVRKLYPDQNARLIDGEVALEVKDASGKPRDVMLNPAGIDSRDLLDLASQAPEIASGIAAAIATKGRGVMRTALQILSSSAASAITGSTRDVLSRKAEGLPLRAEESAANRKDGMLLDMFLQTGLGAAGKSLRAFSPFARDIKPGSMEFDLQQGQKFMRDVFGEDFKATPGEITGSTALKAVEAAESPQPGSRSVMGKIKEQNSETVQRIQQRALGNVTPDEQIGEQAIGTLQNHVVKPLEDALTKLQSDAEAKGQSKVLKLIDDAIGTSRSRVTPTMAGTTTLNEFESKLAEAETKVKAAYAKVNALPGGAGDVLSGDAAAAAAADIRKELPKVIQQVEKPTDLFDEFGRPMTRDSTEERVLRSGVPEGLTKALDDLESLKGGKVSLQTLTNMKRAAYDEIVKTEAVPGVKERWFNKIANAYEQGIDKGIEETGDPALKQALTEAKETYKKELLPFDRPGIKELAKGEFDTARPSPEQIVNRIFQGPKAIENYNLLKSTLGADSPALRTLKRAWADTQLASVTDPITGSVDASGLEKILSKLQVEKPEIAEELFGNKYKDIATELRFLKATQNLKSLDDTEVKVLMGLKNPSKEDLRAILVMQKNRDTSYVNSILKDIADGLPVSPNLKPTEFVKRLQNANTPTADVKQVLDVLTKQNPNAREAIATAQFYKLLDQASIRDAATAAKATTDQPLNLSASKLSEALGREGTPERIRNELLLGDKPLPIPSPTDGEPPIITTRLDVLKNLVNILAPGEVKTSKAFASSGSISGGTAILQALRNPLKYATTFTKNLAIATLYTTEAGTKLASNRVFTPAETAVIAQNMIAMEPFVSRAIETFGPEVARNAIADLKNSIDRYVGDLKAAQEPQRRQAAALGKFLQGQPQKMNIQAQP